MPPAELAAYFTAERQGGFFLVALALVSFGFAATLWANRSAFAAMAWPLVALGSLQLIIGLVVALRTPAQVGANGRLLIVEGIYPRRVDQSLESRGAAANDVNMLVNTGGRQRSEAEFRALYGAAGFTLTRIVPTQTRVYVIEGKPA